MRHKWKEKKKRTEKKKERKQVFLYQTSFFLKTTSNYSTFHTWFTPGSFALYWEAKHFCHTLWGKIEADANDPKFGGLGRRRKYTSRTAILGSFYFPQSRQTAKSLFTVTGKGHTSKTTTKQTVGSLRNYKAIHYLFLKECNECTSLYYYDIEDFRWPSRRMLGSPRPLRLTFGLMIFLISHLLALFLTNHREK